MVDALVEWAEFINEHGVDAAIARADTALAEREAARDRKRCSRRRAPTPTTPPRRSSRSARPSARPASERAASGAGGDVGGQRGDVAWRTAMSSVAGREVAGACRRS